MADALTAIETERLYRLQETAFNIALEGIAAGVLRPDTAAYIAEHFPSLDPAIIPVILHDALTEAQNMGIEREDIDASWL